MDDKQVRQILDNPKFQRMVAQKSTLSWTLALIMLVAYVGFMLLVGYNKAFLMSSFNGGVTTWGIPLGIGIIVLSFLLCAIYSYITNHVLDQLSQDALNEVKSITDRTG